MSEEFSEAKVQNSIEQATEAADTYLDSIQRAYIHPNQGAPAGFILLTCFLDFLGSLHAGQGASGNTFKCFVDTYMVSSHSGSSYDATSIYTSLRCRLVHNYAIWGSKYFLGENRPELHLKSVNNSGIFLNLESFFKDVVRAKDRYFAQVKRDRELRMKLTRRIKKVGTIGDVQISVKQE